MIKVTTETLITMKYTSFIFDFYCFYHRLQTPSKESPSLHGRKSNLNPKFVGTTEAYFVSHIGPKFQISLIYAFIGCPQSVLGSQSSSSQRRKLESIMSPQKGAF